MKALEIRKLWATTDNSGNYKDIFNTREDAEKNKLPYESTVVKGYGVFDAKTGLMPDESSDFHIIKTDAEKELSQLLSGSREVDARLLKSYDRLMDLYEDYQPDDEWFLSDNPETVDAMESIENLNPSTEKDYQESIKELVSFLYEWFPDGIEQSQQDEIREDLKKATLLADADDVSNVPLFYTLDMQVEGNELKDIVHSLQMVIDAIEEGVFVEDDSYQDQENSYKKKMKKRF